MRRSLLAGVAFAALISAPAMAADLGPMRTKAPPIMVPFFSWTGFYVGVNAGYTFGSDSDATTTGFGPGIAGSAANRDAVAVGARPGRVNMDREGFIGGGQVGYNWQFGAWVAGIEADIQYTDIRDNVNIQTVIGAGGAVGPNGVLVAAGTRNNSFSSEMEYFGTVRGRLGYAFDRTLFYATGGLAYGEITNSATFTATGPGFATQFTGGRRNTETGYTVGGGIEHAFGNNWSVKAEYLYYDLGDTSIAVTNVGGPGAAGGPGYDVNFRNEGHIVRAGLNYKFGW